MEIYFFCLLDMCIKLITLIVPDRDYEATSLRFEIAPIRRVLGHKLAIFWVMLSL